MSNKNNNFFIFLSERLRPRRQTAQMRRNLLVNFKTEFLKDFSRYRA